MDVIDREEINGYTKEQMDAAKESINANTDAEISAAIAALQTATGEARDAILTKLSSGGSSVIKSIQRGVIAIPNGEKSATATIKAVNVNKAMVSFLGFDTSLGGSSDDKYKFCYLQLTSSTVVTANKYSISGTSNVSYEVIEFN